MFRQQSRLTLNTAVFLIHENTRYLISVLWSDEEVSGITECFFARVLGRDFYVITGLQREQAEFGNFGFIHTLGVLQIPVIMQRNDSDDNASHKAENLSSPR